MSKKTEYKAIYKCRLCKDTFVERSTKHRDTAIRLIENACCNYMESIIDPTLLTYHFCEDGSIGICDFQGFYLVETEELLRTEVEERIGKIDTDEE